ncbi:ATP-binding cassette domain-containing protein [Amorphus sp. 3PC139-8]|uniref:ATP-binding cassette domain-containing protein n=1 Tax=Amorphus sp. 3PC139-8 TaxID=2735676 RepID=UPI00345C96B4
MLPPWILAALKPACGRVASALSLLLLEKAIYSALPLVFGALINLFVADQLSPGVLLLLVGYGIAGFLVVAAEQVRELAFLPVIQRAQRRLVSSALVELHAKSPEFHAGHASPALTRLISRAAWSLESVFSVGLFDIVPAILQVLIAMGILAVAVDWQTSAVLLLMAAGYAAVTLRAVNKQQGLYRRRLDADSHINAIVGDSLFNRDLVAAYGNANEEARRLSVGQDALERAWTLQKRQQATMRIWPTLIVQSGIVLILLATMLSGDEPVTAGELVMVNMLVMNAFAPLQSVGLLYTAFMQSFTDLRALDHVLAQETTAPPSAARAPLVLRTHLEGKGLTATTRAGARLVDHVDLTLPTGTITAVVGPSGAGKSTLVRLIAGLSEPAAGEILWDGVPIAPNALRANSLYVSQTPALFNDTLLYNIRYGKLDASDGDAMRAALEARLGESFQTRPDGIESPAGEAGVNLSGGERQRVCIARALLAPRPLMILDEATSQLDSVTERAVIANLHAAVTDATFVVITHRLETITEADQILYMEAGSIRETGSHEMLLRLGGGYAALWAARRREMASDAEG